MRRGTPAAYEFGKWLEARRVHLNLSMRAVGARIGVPAATVSQVERGTRALKEPRIKGWATALEISESRFRAEWNKVQREHPDPPLVRPRRQSIKLRTLEDRLSELAGNDRQQVLGYIDGILTNSKGGRALQYQFTRIFDETSSNWDPNPQMNRLFLLAQQNYFNHRLQAYGHVFLNEVYDALGLPRSKEGAMYGWHATPGDFVDWGMIDEPESPTMKLYFNVESIVELLPTEEGAI